MNALALFAAFLLSTLTSAASAAVLLTGHGSGKSAEAAQSAARDDLAYRLQRQGASERELPLIGIEKVNAGGDHGQVRYEARLTEASLAAYEREAARLAQRLRNLDPARLVEGLAWLDQYRRIHTVLGAYSSAARAEIRWDVAVLARRAAADLPPVASAREVAQRVKAALDLAGISGVRVIAPVHASDSEVTGLSASIADTLSGLVSTPGRATRYTLDGWYERVDGRILLALFLVDASFNTTRAFVFVLPAEAEQGFRTPPAASGFGETLSRGLVRLESLDGDARPGQATARSLLGVDVRTERGSRGLYYRPGDRDRLFVRLDRPGYYYIVGHVEKASIRFSYLMEIGEAGSGNRFVRRVDALAANQWQTIGQFTVETPLGLEALQVFATSEPPERALPPARFDPARKLYLIGTDPVEAIQRVRGLVLVNMAGPAGVPGRDKSAARPAIGEAVLRFSTLQ